MIVRRYLGYAAFALLLLTAGCGAPSGGSSGNTVTDREQRQTDALKGRYKDIVTGTDVQDRTLAVYVDVDNMYSMDEDAEASMKRQALDLWTRVWAREHPHRHAVLRLSLRDYYGKEIYSSTAHV